MIYKIKDGIGKVYILFFSRKKKRHQRETIRERSKLFAREIQNWISAVRAALPWLIDGTIDCFPFAPFFSGKTTQVDCQTASFDFVYGRINRET